MYEVALTGDRCIVAPGSESGVFRRVFRHPPFEIMSEKETERGIATWRGLNPQLEMIDVSRTTPRELSGCCIRLPFAAFC